MPIEKTSEVSGTNGTAIGQSTKEKEFCSKLTTLLIEYGFGIAEEPMVYELNSGIDSDYGRTASIASDGRLHFV